MFSLILVATAVSSVSPLMVLLGASGVTTLLMGLLKKASLWVAKQTVGVKQVIVLGIALAVLGISHFLGLPLPTDLSAWDADTINTILSTLLTTFGAFGIHSFKKSHTTS